MMATAGFGALGRDFRYAARLLRRTPGFALTSIGLLALTIGANTAAVMPAGFHNVPAEVWTPLRPVIHSAVSSTDAQLPIATIERMKDVADAALARERFTAVLVMLLGGLATLIAAIGLSGLIASSVIERTRELGIRMALRVLRIHSADTLRSE